MGDIERLVGQRMAAARRRKGLTQLEFADLIGRSESWVSKVETGTMRLDSMALAQSIAELIGIPFGRLVAVDAIDAPTGAPAAEPVASAGPSLMHLVINPQDWDLWDPIKRKWFFGRSAAAVSGALDVMRHNPGSDLTDRVGSIRAGRGRLDVETIVGLEAGALGYRHAYRSASAAALLGPAHGTLSLLVELAADAGPHRDRVVSLIGQMASLVGVLLMLDLGDHDAAARYLTIAARAAHQADDRELMAFTLGGRAFHAAYGGPGPGTGLDYAEAGLDAARSGIHPRTHAWVCAVASEMYATTGSEAGFSAALDDSEALLQRVGAHEGDRAWLGIGAFDGTKLTAYRGTGLTRLGRHAQAQAELLAALDRLDPGMLKHRCTAHIDLAQALIGDQKAEEGADHLMRGLDIIADTRHAESLRRVVGLTADLRVDRSPVVRRLGHRLRELEAMT